MPSKPYIHFAMGTNRSHEITIPADGNVRMHLGGKTRKIRWTSRNFRFRIHFSPVNCRGVTAKKRRAAFWLPKRGRSARAVTFSIDEAHRGAWKYTIVPSNRALPLDPIIIIDT